MNTLKCVKIVKSDGIKKMHSAFCSSSSNGSNLWLSHSPLQESHGNINFRNHNDSLQIPSIETLGHFSGIFVPDPEVYKADVDWRISMKCIKFIQIYSLESTYYIGNYQ